MRPAPSRQLARCPAVTACWVTWTARRCLRRARTQLVRLGDGHRHRRHRRGHAARPVPGLRTFAHRRLGCWPRCCSSRSLRAAAHWVRHPTAPREPSPRSGHGPLLRRTADGHAHRRSRHAAARQGRVRRAAPRSTSTGCSGPPARSPAWPPPRRALPAVHPAAGVAPSAAFGGWLMPVVPPMVSASTGALLVPHAAAGQPRLTLLLGLLRDVRPRLIASSSSSR